MGGGVENNYSVKLWLKLNNSEKSLQYLHCKPQKTKNSRKTQKI